APPRRARPSPDRRRYALALLVDALGAGLLRPFLLLYGVGVLGLRPGTAGLALSAGLLAGLAALAPTGRWIDRGARSLPLSATLLVRAAGAAVLPLAHGVVGFTAAAVLLGVGSQCWPTAHAAAVAALTEGRTRDAALAAGRSLRNAGLGAGALIATAAVAGGAGSLRLLALATGAACLLAAALVWARGGGGGRPRGCGAGGAAPPRTGGERDGTRRERHRGAEDRPPRGRRHVRPDQGDEHGRPGAAGHGGRRHDRAGTALGR
ncbi:MFS transporter, partial [Kitasatospora sp. NPDC059571]|uniref:MFS transporter n=1 Tax=Kitasatospora sp. NPDC059571 TaxID=3346871 RepID=UPI00369F10ED